MNEPSVEETEALFEGRLDDVAQTMAGLTPETPPTTPPQPIEPISIRLAVSPAMAAHLIQARLDVRNGDLSGLPCLMGHLLDPLLREMALDLRERRHAADEDDQSDG